MRSCTFTFIASWIIALLSACSQIEPENPPKGVIPVDTMTLILTKINVLESYIENANTFQLAKYQKTMIKSCDTLLLNEFHVSPERYKTSLLYYTKQEMLMDSIYTEVMDTLSARKARM